MFFFFVNSNCVSQELNRLYETNLPADCFRPKSCVACVLALYEQVKPLLPEYV